ncbi:amino acid adenylation domain-containing protein [Rhizobium cremeum]|uniref:non-ribosomal peptide synthetase/type I polyketide synthase n=1 Tax=Rhizobium cremeum TaxID=2813827 RepID=UPI001FD60F6A|nr:non-ribosomal peptide synthetase/type I polyketide synthase [Rhizobium cremeum]MCJ7997671.1 amino acid adenylation domain-containing protein [Rhizobium cremeum]MCJ8002765.1 amino acid adenylation domain-containing protein [Rhizobium cremeum]
MSDSETIILDESTGHPEDAYAPDGIAIIGMSGRFPGAPSVEALWQLVEEGRNAFVSFSPDEIEDAFTDEERAGADYVAARPFLADVEQFDAEFFGMFPREAAVTDPQHRVFLEICWEALERAGYDPYRNPGLVGVFAGCSMPTYLINNVLGDRAKVEEFTSNYQIGCFNQIVGSITDALSTRVAYKFNLRGPAFTLHSACSTSLLAVSQACQNLLTYGCDMALAGGVSITLPQKRGYLYQEGGMVSRDGICRPFDADASGTVFASGAGVVLLKRLEDALRDGDRVYAVIRGYGVNNDGSDKIGFTAPSAEGQAEAISAAIAHAGIDPATIGYVECHGTATPLGDPIEFSGLKGAFSGAPQDGGTCALGSVKGNVGHMDAAAGVAGLIKAALALHYGKIPAMPNYRVPNPRIDLERSPFYIPTATTDWPESETPRRAGVSSFGVGGTNIHVVLEEAPARPQVHVEDDEGPYILPLSARTEAALSAMRGNLADHLEKNADAPLSQVARTLQEGRHHFAHRTAIAASTVSSAVEQLRSGKAGSNVAADVAPPVVFMFPGQGSQYVGMGAGLYNREPEFTRWIDRGAEVLKMTFNVDVRDYLCHMGPVTDAMAEEQRDTRIAQPCLYLVEHALARLWMSRGLKPDAMIGHSVGEFVAATLANAISFEDALTLVATRGKLMQKQPQGAMLSVRAAPDVLEQYLRGGAEIAAINAPKLCVASGPFKDIDAVCAELEKAGIAFSRLHTSHAFHSAMMEPCIDDLREQAARVTYGTATIPYISCVTGDWQTDELGRSPDYWARHCREAVRFSDGLLSLCRDRKPILIEVGPGRTLSVFASQTISRDGVAAIIQSMPEHDRAHAGAEVLAEAQGKLWMAGRSLAWPALPDTGERALPLPTYPFQRQRHWIDAPPSARRAASAPQPSMLLVEPNGEIEIMSTISSSPAAVAARIPELETSLLALLSDMSGETLDGECRASSFLELGFDSLFIGQFAQKIDKQYGIKISFRELLSNIPTVADLARYLDGALPPEPAPQPAPVAASAPAPQPVAAASAMPATMVMPATSVPAISGQRGSGLDASLEAVLQSQLSLAQTLFAQQFQVLQAAGAASSVPAALPAVQPAFSQSAPPPTVAVSAPAPVPAALSEDQGEIGSERIRLYRPDAKKAGPELTPEKKAFVDDIVATYAERNKGSKAFTEKNRARLADPRTASGFRADWKEMIFPIVSNRSKGSRIWDVDGHEYIDLVNGFGQTAFGHAPDFVVEAMKKQMDAGFAIGPQTPLAGEAAELICELTGHERVTFCNTGSEAVMAAMRVARAVTGRERIVIFANDYHGQFDEVLVKGRNRGGNPVALPIAAGIPNGSVSNMVVLRYGAPESLDWIRANADDVAAVIIEPVQSRHPELRPQEFVRSLRDIATASEFALVFDEVVTGFRVHSGGMQAVWGIRGDMATYGKVVGGGMPIGVLTGDSRFMDALDGGYWNYGDDSVPMVAPTFFAGTFVRHPVVLSAVKAVLEHIKGEGAALYDRVANRTEALVAEINSDLEKRGIGPVVNGYKSWFYTDFSSLDPLGGLIYPLMRMNGIHTQDGYPCFLTTEHSEADFQAIAQAYRDAVDALQSVGILAPKGVSAPATVVEAPVRQIAIATERPQSAPLTEAQSEIWLAAQLGEEASCSFNESFTLTLDGSLDQAAFLQALKSVIDRHDALHIRFDRNGERFSFIPDFDLGVDIVDLAQEGDGEEELRAIIDDEAHMPFDLVKGPLARAKLVKLGTDRHAFVFTAHHIVCDGWSMNVLVEELSAAYSALVRGENLQFDPALSFATYATDLAPDAEVNPDTQKFWLDQFRDIPEPAEMPFDRAYPEQRTFAGGTCTVKIGADVYKDLKKRGARSGATLFSTLLAALQVMVARLSGQPDVVIAVPSAGQSLLDGQTLVGHCVNLLPLRQMVEASKSFETHLKATQQLVLKAFEHQDYTYGTLVKTLGVKRDPRRLPLTGIQFNLERVAGNAEFSGLTARMEPNPKAFSNFDMFLNMIEGTDGIRIDVDYNADVLDRETVERWVGHFVSLVTALAKDMEQPIAALSLLSPQETEWLVHGLNQSTVDYDRDAFVFSLFSRKAAEHPDKVAAVHRGKTITYGDLDARSNRLARHIRSVVSGEGQRIALLVDRSLDMLVALLAIMKSGHAYIPLDPGHPEPRLRQTLEAARPVAMICDSEAGAALAGDGVAIIRTDRDAQAFASLSGDALETLPSDTETTAYVIFTSGSTGTPKGVAISHRALTNFMLSMEKEPGLAADDTLVAVTTISFDIAGLELYLPLIAGAKVVIADRTQVQDGFALVRLVEESNATVLQATPTLWQMLVEAGMGKTMRLKKLCGGEPLPKDLARTLVRMEGELWNMYGPTETTIWSSVERVLDNDTPITIGHPIANTQLYILDQDGRIAPVGVTGELHIGGDGLAQGYFDRPDLTDAAFVQRDIGTGEMQRLYKTGDVGRRLTDGSLQLLGRRDNQIKLRGFRIELGDIEAVISKVEGVRQCAVVGVRNSKGDVSLACYYVTEPGTSLPDAAGLAALARANLPAYMVPSAWVLETALPQTANGKLDRKALEKRDIRQQEAAAAATKVKPRTEMETKLWTIWKSVLDVENIGVEDNLYALGADSLTIFRIAARMLDAGLPLEAKHLLRHPSIAELAAYAEEQKEAEPAGITYHIPSLKDFRNGARRRVESVS